MSDTKSYYVLLVGYALSLTFPTTRKYVWIPTQKRLWESIGVPQSGKAITRQIENTESIYLIAVD